MLFPLFVCSSTTDKRPQWELYLFQISFVRTTTPKLPRGNRALYVSFIRRLAYLATHSTCFFTNTRVCHGLRHFPRWFEPYLGLKYFQIFWLFCRTKMKPKTLLRIFKAQNAIFWIQAVWFFSRCFGVYSIHFIGKWSEFFLWYLIFSVNGQRPKLTAEDLNLRFHVNFQRPKT